MQSAGHDSSLLSVGPLVFADGDSGGVLGVPGVLQRPNSNPVICGSKPYVTSCQVTFWTPLFGNPGADVLSLLGEKDERMQNIPSPRQIGK